MLISCPECGKDVSDKAPTCPACGVPISAKAPEPTKPLATAKHTHRPAGEAHEGAGKPVVAAYKASRKDRTLSSAIGATVGWSLFLGTASLLYTSLVRSSQIQVLDLVFSQVVVILPVLYGLSLLGWFRSPRISVVATVLYLPVALLGAAAEEVDARIWVLGFLIQAAVWAGWARDPDRSPLNSAQTGKAAIGTAVGFMMIPIVWSFGAGMAESREPLGIILAAILRGVAVGLSPWPLVVALNRFPKESGYPGISASCPNCGLLLVHMSTAASVAGLRKAAAEPESVMCRCGLRYRFLGKSLYWLGLYNLWFPVMVVFVLSAVSMIVWQTPLLMGEGLIGPVAVFFLFFILVFFGRMAGGMKPRVEFISPEPSDE